MKRAFLYLRVSTEEQKKHGLSVDTQLEALEKFCKENNYVVAGIYNDAGISAHVKYTKRKDLVRMIEDANRGAGDIILFTKLDRWFRSVDDYYDVMRQLPDGFPWKAIWEDYETETSAGRFKVNIMLSIAQAEAERTSERIRAVLDYKRAKGEYVGGNAPTGYLYDIESKTLIKDESTRKGMESFFSTYLQTGSRKLAIESAKKYGVNIPYGHFARVVKNPSYTGNIHGYTFEPYITEQEHYEIIKLVKKQFRSRTGTVYFFTGLLLCPYCNKRLVTTMVRTGKNEYKYYRCQSGVNHETINLNEKKIEKNLLAILEKKLNTYNAQILKKSYAKESSAKIKKLEERLERIGIRFEDGDITVEEYKEKRNAIKSEIANLKIVKPEKNVIELPQEWKEIYNKLNDQNKQAFWRGIIDTIVMQKDYSCEINFR
jgi:site-specific DNA recombinase